MIEGISDELKERYKAATEIVYSHRGDRKAEFNKRAQSAIDVMRETLPDLDDTKVFTVLSSIAYLLSTFMLTPLAKAGTDIEELFDAYTLASASLLGIVDLADESAPVSQAELEKRAMLEEIKRLTGELEAATQRPSSDDNTGLYL